jgi:hypothetical protein
MKQVFKSDGSVVPFDREKLVQSVWAAGASEATSEEVANEIGSKGDSMSSHEIRQLVMLELGERDQSAARRYDASRRLVARLAVEVPCGVVRLPAGILMSMGLSQGETVQLYPDDRVRTVQAELNEWTVIAKNEVRLNTQDLEELHVEDGGRILLVRQSHYRVLGQRGSVRPGHHAPRRRRRARALVAR